MPDAGHAASRTACGIVAAATLFNAALCFCKTAGLPVGLPLVQAMELAILAAAALMTIRLSMRHLLAGTLLIALNIMALALIGDGMDFKIAIDLAIVVLFALLGRVQATPDMAHRLLWVLALTTLVFGLYEMFALDSFERYFHIYDYYVGKGALDATHAGDTGTLLAENGVRPEDQGRQLLPGLLGLHRVGSIFLEPVSAGNFAVICIIWVCARRDVSLSGLGLAAMGLAIGVLADARFSILCSMGLVLLLVTSLWRSRLFVTWLPVVLVALLCVLGASSTHDVDNSILGRLTGSGRLLQSWSLWQWLGVSSTRAVSLDTGYSYVIGNLGVLATLATWAALCRAAPGRAAARRLFAAASVYVSLSLCISASALSIKTGALLWFLVGSLAGLPNAVPSRLTRERYPKTPSDDVGGVRNAARTPSPRRRAAELPVAPPDSPSRVRQSPA